MIQIGGVYTTFCQKEGILLQKHRDRNGRCIAILFRSIRVRGRFDSSDVSETFWIPGAEGPGDSLGDSCKGQAGLQSMTRHDRAQVQLICRTHWQVLDVSNLVAIFYFSPFMGEWFTDASAFTGFKQQEGSVHSHIHLEIAGECFVHSFTQITQIDSLHFRRRPLV